MTIEVALVISGLSLAFGIYQGISNMKRNSKADAQADASQLTTVIVKLENIGSDLKELKTDLKDMKDDLKDHAARIVRLEQQVKVLNNHIFGKEGKKDEEN